MCNEIFLPIFFMIRTHVGAPYNQAKMFSNSFSISPRYSFMKFENSGSSLWSVYDTGESKLKT